MDLSFIDFLDLEKLQAIQVGMFEALGGITLAYLANLVRKTSTSYIATDLRNYIGTYTGFRGTGNTPDKVICPKIEIRRHWRKGFSVFWTAPNSHTAVEFKISSKNSSREIYCTGIDDEKNRQSFLILHKNYDNGTEFICGHYLFLNQLNEVVSGNLLLLKDAKNWDAFKSAIKLKCTKDEARSLRRIADVARNIQQVEVKPLKAS